MKNCRPYDGNPFEFYKKVCSKKQDAALVARLLAMDNEIENLFNAYNNHFNANTLERLVASGYVNQPKADLEQLYNYKSATLTKLREKLTTTNSKRVVKCQNCTINNVSTFDHLLPQGEFAEFIVHPLNLLCCCADCNPRKNNVWRQGGRRIILNLYLDELPTEQYLFVTVDVGDSGIETTFFLDNRNHIDVEMFNLLSEHYTRLNLFERFSDDADTVVTSLLTVLEPLRDFHDLAETKAIILQSIEKERIAFGPNYWQAILKLELINNDDFMEGYE